MDGIQNLIGAAQRATNTVQRTINVVQKVVSKEQERQTQQVVSKDQETQAQQVVPKSQETSQVNKYFWDGVIFTIASGFLLFSISDPKRKVTHEESHEQITEQSSEISHAD